MKELKKLGGYATVLIIVGLIVLMGIAIVDKYSYVVRDRTTTTLSSFTLGAVNASTSLGTSYPYVQALTGCYNASNTSHTLSTDYYRVTEGGRTQGYITLLDAGAGWATLNINCSTFTYLKDSTAQASADLFKAGLAVFGAFIGIIVLALIGKMVVGMFQNKEGREDNE